MGGGLLEGGCCRASPGQLPKVNGGAQSRLCNIPAQEAGLKEAFAMGRRGLSLPWAAVLLCKFFEA